MKLTSTSRAHPAADDARKASTARTQLRAGRTPSRYGSALKLVTGLLTLMVSFEAPGIELVEVGKASDPDRIEISGLAAGAFHPELWQSNTLHWVPDLRFPILAPLPGKWTNIYAPSAVEIPGKGWRVFFGGWDGVPTGNDRIFSVTTPDFLSFAERQTVIEHHRFIHVCNVHGTRLTDGSFRLICTTYPDAKGLNKPAVFTSPDGVTWNGGPTPYLAQTSDQIEITGYPGFSEADINGVNVLLHEGGKWHLYFGDFKNFGKVQHAVGEDGKTFRYLGTALLGNFMANDVQKFVGSKGTNYLMGIHMNGPQLSYALSTNVNTFHPAQPLFSPQSQQDHYRVAIGWVTSGPADQPGRRLLGVLYGAGPVKSLDRNQIYARWLQKRVVLAGASGKALSALGAMGPDRIVFKAEEPVISAEVFAEDGRTPLWKSEAGKPTLTPGRNYRLQ